MKSYISDRQIRLVGKAWEIKRYLQLMLQQTDKDVTLIDCVNAMPTLPQRKWFEKKRNPGIIPFPSR
ncbi:Z-ring formation inhibitor MciZ [Paenibacillus sp. SYP-B3998]|uniref:Z-ring formation inhibitor MciZ n=1 Tax=Paenibacillus sp. SYP-B3998 TaxID=2678564 RepID=A0A6G3ZWT0_9BACL|nr:Z-ring formation inhibitor MciZ [Paenibacillus sp. SYP-B3998]